MMNERPKNIPASPGVYAFRRGKTPLYIGKAANLKKRLASYFRTNAGDKVRRLREEATALDWIELNSEIEALIREAEEIKKHLPKFNVLLRDDKSYSYAVFTREKFPRIFVAHKTQIDRGKFSRVIGPFTGGMALRMTLKMLRRSFPYCTCATAHKRPCLNAQIGRCPGFCCNEEKLRTMNNGLQNHYGGNVKNIAAILGGKKIRLLSGLKKEMRVAAKKQDFERAARLRDQIGNVENIFSHRGVLAYAGTGRRKKILWSAISREIQTMLGAKRKISRAEGCDISNISGTAATGSMVVFINGTAKKSAYRKFKIKTVRGANDVAMHYEVMRRRLAHSEWPYPDIIVMDGGKPQFNAAAAALRLSKTNRRRQMPILTALAKREEELYSEGRQTPVRLDSLSPDAMHFFQRVRDESHRFAKAYHHKLREMSYRSA